MSDDAIKRLTPQEIGDEFRPERKLQAFQVALRLWVNVADMPSDPKDREEYQKGLVDCMEQAVLFARRYFN